MDIPDAERLRLEKLWEFEKRLNAEGYTRVAGVDEAGRGPLAGPVVAACVILPKGILLPGIDDSKKLTEKKRESLYADIVREAVYNIACVGAEEIDAINILNATHAAMKAAVAGMRVAPDHTLIDGLPIKAAGFLYTPIIGGDGKSVSIAAASILAKVYRDSLMREYALRYPEYGFERHKGYGTAAHMEAIRRYGPCPIHRRSFLKNIR